MEGKLAHRIIEERETNGKYTSLENFVKRTQTGVEQVVILIRVGALRFTGTGKSNCCGRLI
ncbi:hypothetical protein [Sphingobacterium siyangense]|uniref:helix-hairpin-helix domain-containing protein n=1 Tax=Sphingobacterium siyangense TaxID=459529 RepID=UPI003C730162